MTRPPTPPAGPYNCPTCGLIHPLGCQGHTNIRDETGTIIGTRECRAAPRRGLTVCIKHGASNAAAKAKSQRIVAEQVAAREVARLGVKITTHPAEALVDLVHWTAGEVAYWRGVVTQLERDGGHRALTWGVSRVKEGGDDAGTTQEAKPHAAYLMLTQASDRLASYSTAALKAGVDERRVRLAEAQGALVADVIRGVLTALNLTPEQWELVPTVVPAQLRLLTSNPSTIGA